MKKDPVDITPQNAGDFAWNGKNLEAFENDWSMKPVSVSAVFDNDKEI